MATEPEKGSDVADVYAAALFALASEAQAVDAVERELAELARLAAQDAGFAAFLNSTAVDADSRQHSLERMFRGRLSDLTLDTLHVMNQHGRAGLLHPLWGSFVRRREVARGQVAAVATTAVPLDAGQQRDVVQLAGQLSGKQALVQFVVDAGIVGGLILQIGGCRYDNSVRRHLHGAQQGLLERSARGELAQRSGLRDEG